VGGLNLAALYTLQHRLTGDAESTGGLLHGDESLAGRGGEACLQCLGQSDPPRRPRVTCSPAIMPSFSQRCRVEGATFSSVAAAAIVMTSPTPASDLGSKQGMRQWVLRLLTLLASNEGRAPLFGPVD